MEVLLALISCVLADKYVSVEYQDSFLCEGTPDVLLGVSITDQIEPSVGQISPCFLYLLHPDQCGNAPLDVNGCCISIIENSSMEKDCYPYKGGFLGTVDDYADVSTLLPYKTSSERYCQMFSIDNSTFGGYDFLYLLGNGKCNEGYYICNADGTLELYEEINCTGDYIAVQLTDQMQEHNSTYLNVNATLFAAKWDTLESGSGVVEWTTFQPATDFIPNHKWAMEVIALILYIIAVASTIISVIYWIYKYHHRSISNNFMFILVPFLDLIYEILRIYYAYTIFDNYVTFYSFKMSKNFAFGISTLASVCNSSIFIGKILHLEKRQLIGVLIFVVLVHVWLVGGLYADDIASLHYFYMERDNYLDNFDINVFEWTKSWSLYFSWWVIFMFIWNLVPIILIVQKLTQKIIGSISFKLNALQQADKWFIPLSGCQLFLISLYLVCGFLQTQTLSLRNDRNYLAIDGFQLFCISMTCLLNNVLLEIIKEILINKKMKKAVANSKNKLSTNVLAKTQNTFVTK
jgi:hypothetical protein